MTKQEILCDALKHFLFRVHLSDGSSSRPVTAREYSELVDAIKELAAAIIAEME